MSEYEKLHQRISQLVKRNDEFEIENRELREKLYRAENPEFNGRLDTWQAACGKARGEAESLREENKKLKAAIQEATYRVDLGKIWNGMGYTYTGLGAHAQQKVIDILDAALK